MELKPPTFRSMMIGLAIVFGGYAAMTLYHHDLNNGLWSFAGLLGACARHLAAVADGSLSS
jgi:hypothetical protein